ncbi:uncharacterized protein LOC127806323 [Diospyros lotus]|uniref:uncharacterized protein LOC127806323 n=1 Tax=Diospyros lotus TaxID=55363 RepID=UPI00225882DF|nr:uncharacterized protein LOC127806323 [Diospyros lotus]
MSKLPEINDLFARLAVNLQTLDPTAENENQEPLDGMISNLNQSLNLPEGSRARVLDTALSLMCFRAPQVFDSVIEYLVKTILAVVSSSMTCKALRFQKTELLSVGSEISSCDCAELIEVCADILAKLQGHGILSHSLLRAVVKAAVSASCFYVGRELKHSLDVKSMGQGRPTISMLLCYVPKDISLNNQEIPLRLLFWYLDPQVLKNDVSLILQDATHRPFLCLNIAFRERTDWHSVVICLALSPAMFVETRTLLHNWFLMTGLPSVLELQIELVSLILDVVSRPMWWDITMEIGQKLPTSHAYFPHKHWLLRTLDGPLSFQNFLYLVHSTNKPAPHDRRQLDPNVKQAAISVGMIDHKSCWALAMNFPNWFFYALMLLLCEKSFHDNCPSKGAAEAAETKRPHYVELPCSTAAARYIAWILNPLNESQQELLVECLSKLSESWALKKRADTYYKETAYYRTKLEESKFHNCDGNTAQLQEYDCETVQLWLQEFHSLYINYWIKTLSSSTACEAKACQGIGLPQNMMFRRIPLGFLIGSSNGISEDGCQLLLHYAATGKLLKLMETGAPGLKHGNWNTLGQDDSMTWFEKCSATEVVNGASLVFRLTDVVESMASSLFATEESELDFICRLKLRAGKYLFNCLKKLLQHTILVEDDGLLMLRDLSSRLVRWRHQGQDVFQDSRDLNDILDALNHKLSSF